MATRQKEKTAKVLKEKDTRPQATAKYVRMGATKAKRVLDMIKGKSYIEALALVDTTASTSAGPVKKVLNSAAANAENNLGLNKDDLFVASAVANQGSTYKRRIWRGKGGSDIILKRTCHITIVLDVKK